jgi:arylsulfatase A-like enzyme
MPARPNVVVIMADQLKATASHLWGNPFCATPALARLAAAGTLFDVAITPQPLCVPARVSLWTGRWPHAHGARRNETPMPAGEAHAFRLWREAGYATAMIGKDHCFAAEEDRALFDVWCELGHEGPKPDRPARGMAWVRPLADIEAGHARRRAMPRQGAAVSYAVSDVDPRDASSGVLAAQAVAYLEGRADSERPFALWLSFPDPHTPYEVPRAYADLVPPESVDLPPPLPPDAALPERTRVLQRLLGIDDASENDRRALVATYHAMVRFVDDGVGLVLDALERTGLTDDTIVVFCADHGDFAGEHGLTRKGGAFYDAMVRVPLIVAWPGVVPAGAVEPSPVNLVDLVPTLLSAAGAAGAGGDAGAAAPHRHRRPAARGDLLRVRRRRPALHARRSRRPARPRGLEAGRATLRWREAEGRRKMVRTRRHKYVTDPMGDLDELYDLEADPHEGRNLAAERGHEALIADLRARLFAWMVATEDARPVPLPDPVARRDTVADPLPRRGPTS